MSCDENIDKINQVKNFTDQYKLYNDVFEFKYCYSKDDIETKRKKIEHNIIKKKIYRNKIHPNRINNYTCMETATAAYQKYENTIEEIINKCKSKEEKQEEEEEKNKRDKNDEEQAQQQEEEDKNISEEYEEMKRKEDEEMKREAENEQEMKRKEDEKKKREEEEKKKREEEEKKKRKEDEEKKLKQREADELEKKRKADEDNLNNIRNNLIQFTKTVLIDANATVSLLNDVVYNLEIVLEYDEEKKDTTKSAIKAVKKAVDSAEKAVESSKKAFQSTGETVGFINNANETAPKMQLKKNNTKQLHDNQIMVDQINIQMNDLQQKTIEVFNTVQKVKDAIDKLQQSKEKPNEKTGGAPLNDITTAVKTAIENAQNAIQSTETAIDSVNTLRKMISTNSELVLDSIQNSFLSEVFKFFTDNTANKVDNDEGKKFIESTELNTTYMYGELPSKKDMLKCETLEKEEEKEKCIYDLQKKQNLLEEYTIQEKHEDSFMVPWSMENFLYMLSDTKSNISRYKQVYYKTDDTANPVYTHKVSKTVKKRIPVMEYDSDPDNPKNVVE
jgi:hypothetical protein